MILPHTDPHFQERIIAMARMKEVVANLHIQQVQKSWDFPLNPSLSFTQEEKLQLGEQVKNDLLGEILVSIKVF